MRVSLRRVAILFFVSCSGMRMEAVSLVPAVREFRRLDGCYALKVRRPTSAANFYDFDLAGCALDSAKFVRSEDPSLPESGYRLKVSAGGVEIAAPDDAGRFYALMTLRQLAEETGPDSVAIPCCEIRDWPAYRWRGMMIDEARHFLGKTAVKRVIDLMAAHKMNVLHWHLADDQGWRLELKRHPELVEYGAVRPQSVKLGTHARWLPPDGKLSFEYDNEKYGPFFHSQEDVREILVYAKANHVTVVPEIELPGHVRALLAAHPEFSCKGDLPRVPRVGWSIEDEVLCVGNDAALAFLEDVFDEVCEMFPDTKYIHIGGDECPRVRWKSCPKCQARMRAGGMKDESGLQAWVTSRFVKCLERKGRRAVGWDEILAGDVPKSAVGMTWRLSAKGGAGTAYVSAAEAAHRGHDMVMTPTDSCYLSRRQFESGDPFPYYSPTGPLITLEKAYGFDPASGIPPEDRVHVLGGQASVWGESVFNVFDLEWKTWPRACAIAEVLWAGDRKPGYEDFMRRMKTHRRKLIGQGVNCAPLQEDRNTK